MLAGRSGCEHHDSTHAPAPNAPGTRTLQQTGPRRTLLPAARRLCPSPWQPQPATSPPRAFLANGRAADPLPSPATSRGIAQKMTPKEELEQLASARTESGVELFLA